MRRSAPTATTERGQTTIDFAAGISIFLVTVAFAFAFVPGILTPFSGSGVGDPITANSVADELAADRLASPESPYVLNETATVAFFTANPTLSDNLTIGPYDSVNVSLENVTDPSKDYLTIDGERAVRGAEVPDAGDVTVAWRVVTFRGERAELVVRVW
jgi:hypothetical protein